MSVEILTKAIDLGRVLKDKALEFDGVYTDEAPRYGKTGDVTYEVDIPVEEAVSHFFSDLDISCRVMTEDTGIIDYGKDPEFIFLIDPVDGSRNLRRSLPFNCASIAVYDINATEISQATVAVIERFDLDEEYIAVAGGGATLNGDIISPSAKQSFDDAIIALGSHFISSISYFASSADKIGTLTSSDERDIMVKCYGATALELALLASGKIDLIYDLRASTDFKATPKTYDIAAGLLICKEAGAVISYGSEKIGESLKIEPQIPVQLIGAGNLTLFNNLSNILQ